MTQQIKSLHGGSGACTRVLKTAQGELFVRKTAEFPQSVKLAAQYNWLQGHQHLKWVPNVRLFGEGDDSLFLDLTYYDDFEPFYDFVHREPPASSIAVLDRILDTLQADLYGAAKPVRSVSKLDCYLHTKVFAKWSECILRSPRMAQLAQSRELIINGIAYLNLPWILNSIRSNRSLIELLANFEESTVHGDLTIENILVREDEFKIVDPNSENWICDPMVDFAKLYQSLHSNYEELIRISHVQVCGHRIFFRDRRSAPYEMLFKHLETRLRQTYPERRLRSLLFHEAMHFFRLLPYRLDRDEGTFPLFYATAVRLFNEFYENQR